MALQPRMSWRRTSRSLGQNGLADEELAEVIYHASGDAGFPAANTARNIAADVLDG